MSHIDGDFLTASKVKGGTSHNGATNIAQEENSCQIKMSSSNSPLANFGRIDGCVCLTFVSAESSRFLLSFVKDTHRAHPKKNLQEIIVASNIQIICPDNIQPVHLLLCQLVYINYHVKLSRLDDDHQPSTCSKCKKIIQLL